MSSAASSTFQDRTLNKVALCSAVFAGFAYVGYSYARTAFCGRYNRRNRDEDPSGVSHVLLRRLSQTTQTDALMGNLEYPTTRLVLRPKSVQERIKELNQRAQYFSDAFLAIQSGADPSMAITRNHAMHAPKSVQCSPWHSPRVLSPVDVRHLICSKSTENLTHIPQSSSPISWKRKSLKKKKKGADEPQDKERLQQEAIHLYQTQSDDQRKTASNSSGKLLTPYEAKSLVALLYSPDKSLIERTLVTIANCSAFSVNLDFLRESGCIHRLCDLLEEEEVRLAAVQTLGNVILSEQNIRQAKDCLPRLMQFVMSDESAALRLASLIVLTNIATTNDWHHEFIDILDKLYWLVASCGSHVQLQSLRLLVNLSCNKEMIPKLLDAQGPSKLSALVSMSTPDPILLRVIGFLNSLCTTVRKQHLTSCHLPSDQNDRNDDNITETLSERLSRLFGASVHDDLLVHTQQILQHHSNPQIRTTAQKLLLNLQC